jgi:hypothetical protein
VTNLALAVPVAVAVLSPATDDTPESELDKYQETWVLLWKRKP